MTPPSLTLVTYQELATAWKLSPQTIRRWVHEDEKRGRHIPRIRQRVRGVGYVVLLRADVAHALLLRHRPGLSM